MPAPWVSHSPGSDVMDTGPAQSPGLYQEDPEAGSPEQAAARPHHPADKAGEHRHRRGRRSRGEHVQGGRFGLRPVPRRGHPPVCGVGAGVAVEVVPDDEQAVAEQPESNGARHGLGHPVAGLPDAEDVFHVEEGDLDAPPGRVAGDDLLRCGGEVGGDQPSRSSRRPTTDPRSGSPRSDRQSEARHIRPTDPHQHQLRSRLFVVQPG